MDFTANTKVFQRQTAVFVECVFQQTSELAFQALGPVWRQPSIRCGCCTSWEKGFGRVFWRQIKPVALPELLKPMSEQRSWTVPWWNSSFCGNLSSQPEHSAPRTDHSVSEGQKHITENRMLHLRFVLLLVPSHKLVSFFFRCWPWSVYVMLRFIFQIWKQIFLEEIDNRQLIPIREFGFLHLF